MKINFLYRLIIVSLVIGVEPCSASITDTIVNKDSLIEFWHIDDFGPIQNNSRILNLELDGFQIYNPINLHVAPNLNKWNSRYYHNGFLRMLHGKSLGFTGSASQSLFFYSHKMLGFGLGRSSFKSYQQVINDIKYYRLGSPFTELYYVTGSKKEQILRVTHAQQVAKKFNIGIELKKINSDGFYVRQKTDHTSFSANLDYTTPKERYKVLLSGIWNTNYAQENGGIKDDLLFEDSLSITKNTIEVYLDSAENSWKSNDLILKQFFRIGKNNRAELDSGTTVLDYSKHHLYHSLQYMNRSNRYTDHLPNPEFYPVFFNDSSYTSDQLEFINVQNTIGWSSLNLNDLDSLAATKVFDLSLGHEYAEYHLENLDSFMSNAMARIHFAKRSPFGFSYSLLGDIIWFGPNQGDYKINARGFLKTSFSNTISLTAEMCEQTPNLFQSVYSSNHYQWNNQFLKSNVVSSILDFSNEAIQFNWGLGFQLLKNHMYFDTLALPTQYNGSFPVFSLYAGKNFKMGNLKLNSRVVAQYVEDNLPIRIPNLVTYNSLYYSNWIFKKALFIQFGIDIWYNTSYYADAYMPVTSEFYNQNVKKIGNYPYVDAFVNFKIKNARIFVKLAHLNSGLMGNRYYMVPHYPMYDRSFKFGVSWVFND